MLVLSLLLSLVGCTPKPQLGPDDQAAAAITRTWCALLAKGEVACSPSGGSLEVLGHSVTIQADKVLEHKALGSTTLEYDVSVRLDNADAPSLSLHVAGSGSSLDEARNQAATVWVSVLGAPLTDRLKDDGRLLFLQRLQDDQPAPPAFESAGWVAYPGWTILLGQRTEPKPVDIQDLLDAVMPLGTAWSTDAGATHVIQLYLELRDGVLVDPHCTVDGQPSREACDRAAAVRLPRGHYILRQSFVLRPGSLGGAAPVASPE